MPEVIPQSTTKRVPLKVFLTGSTTPATGKTVAVTISKNGGAFANPAAGATNATEIASGWYYVDLGVLDTATLGPLVVLGTASGCDNSDRDYVVGVVPSNVTQFGGTAGTFAAGRPEVNTTHVRGTAVNSGAIAGYFPADILAIANDGGAPPGLAGLSDDYAGGYIQANLVAVMGTLTTESAGGRLAGAYSVFFDVAAPAGTVNSLPAAAPGLPTGLVINGSNIGAIGFSSTFTITGALAATSASNDIRGCTLAAAGLDQITATAPTALATNFRTKMLQVWEYCFGKKIKDTGAGTITVFQGTSSTPQTTAAFTSVGGVDTVAKAT